jgi:hypothetical protein
MKRVKNERCAPVALYWLQKGGSAVADIDVKNTCPKVLEVVQGRRNRWKRIEVATEDKAPWYMQGSSGNNDC